MRSAARGTLFARTAYSHAVDRAGGRQAFGRQSAEDGAGALAGADSKLLILDEPTRGVDVGAKADIYAIIDRLAAEGVAILVISSELPEVLGLADRIVVMQGGRVAGVLTRGEASEEKILRLAILEESGMNRPPRQTAARRGPPARSAPRASTPSAFRM